MAHEGERAISSSAAERIAPIHRRDLTRAVALLRGAYCGDPTFAGLYNLPNDQLRRTWPLFRRILESTVPLHTSLGCYRDGKLVGVVSYCPDSGKSLWWALGHDLVTALGWLTMQAWIRLRHRLRLGVEGKARWGAYTSMALAHATSIGPNLHVLALAVADAARRSGVARRLLAAMEMDARWPGMPCVVVDTWHPSKVAVYESLGFRVAQHGSRDGVECWSMLRPIAHGAGVSAAEVARG